MFISVEGINGSGKSTQLRKLYAYLKAKNKSVITTKEPGGTPVGDTIRSLALYTEFRDSRSELCLFFADRYEHCERVIKPALKNNTIVLCDRFVDSTYAYQQHASDLTKALLVQLDRLDCIPDITLLYDLPVAIADARIQARGDRDAIESRPQAFHEQVRQAYLARAAAAPDRICCIDATPDADTVFNETRKYVKLRLNL